MKSLEFYPQPSRPDNPTPLDMAIYNYELKAKAHYDSKLRFKGDDVSLQGKIKRDFEHLQNEKRRLLSIAIARDSLNGYREFNETANVDTLTAEEHHPTDKLAQFLAASGEPKPTVNHELHHIVPGKGRFRQADVMRARLTMHMWHVGINDPLNGVWLLNYKKISRMIGLRLTLSHIVISIGITTKDG